jgi:hypothetical protein
MMSNAECLDDIDSIDKNEEIQGVSVNDRPNVSAGAGDAEYPW